MNRNSLRTVFLTTFALLLGCAGMVVSNAVDAAGVDPVLEARQIVQNEYARLREEVVRDIAEGNRDAAMSRIARYESRMREYTTEIPFRKVAGSFNADVVRLKSLVEESLAPTTALAAGKQMSGTTQSAKYALRRSKGKP